ncbi:DUF6247 family protein [Actinomycetospora sp. OC33-EN07]|uniref:DUF6247 family protein n=1 Tax=Actinomycetospora flava TaxID=3129232 RepID=A0ABU8M8E1_9PSEU
MYSVDDEPARGHPLRKGASPGAIRSALLPEDQAGFDADYEQALTRAGASRDLTELFTVLEHWRRLAVLQSEPEVFRRVARRAAELHTGAPRPEDEPLSVTRSHTGI